MDIFPKIFFGLRKPKENKGLWQIRLLLAIVRIGINPIPLSLPVAALAGHAELFGHALESLAAKLAGESFGRCSESNVLWR